MGNFYFVTIKKSTDPVIPKTIILPPFFCFFSFFSVSFCLWGTAGCLEEQTAQRAGKCAPYSQQTMSQKAQGDVRRATSWGLLESSIGILQSQSLIQNPSCIQGCCNCPSRLSYVICSILLERKVTSFFLFHYTRWEDPPFSGLGYKHVSGRLLFWHHSQIRKEMVPWQ